ncbi:MAG: hypothetical protein J1F61_00785 [Clostridiales bacterium]|nr:hypothetical protein [Clostridiales bacterium]
MKVVKYIAFVLLGVAVVIFVGGIILAFARLTNGFKEDIKTFYIEYGDELITAKESKVSINRDSENRFNVKYALGFAVNDNADKTYTVEIIPNQTYKDLIYTVDGEEYQFGNIKDFSDVFEYKRAEEYFILRTSETVNLISVLSAKYPGRIVEVSDDFAKVNNYYYTLRVSSHSKKTVYNINFNFNAEINIDKDGVVF